MNQTNQPQISTPTEDQCEQMLKARGVISEIPERAFDAEEDFYEPVEIAGKPLSETIIEEREASLATS